jgi:predicted Fe-Mo cluster-binding NifX family protein
MKRIAIPTADGRLSTHFGHAPQFVVFDIDVDQKQVQNRRVLDAPPHQPGLLPRWLASEGVEVVLAGGMGGRARQIFAEQGIDTIVGVAAVELDTIVQAYVDGTLKLDENACNHGQEHRCH